jgi:hypothetical protein
MTASVLCRLDHHDGDGLGVRSRSFLLDEEFKDSDCGLCSYRVGKFPTAECTWNEYLDKAN